MQVYLSVTPADCRTAMQYHRRLAHVAYRIGPESRLLRQNLLMQTKGGLMSLSDRDAPPIARPEVLCREIWQECAARSYAGVLADFEAAPTQDRLSFLDRLCTLLHRNKRRLYLPEVYARQVNGAVAIICTALSGGSFCQRLQEAAVRFGKNRVARDVQRLAMDFTLPSPTGRGRPLPPEELRELMDRLTPSTFYSAELCAKYFTCTQNGESRFFLYDDADTIRQKIRTGHSMGFPAAFLMYPEVHDLLPQLFPRSGGTR